MASALTAGRPASFTGVSENYFTRPNRLIRRILKAADLVATPTTGLEGCSDGENSPFLAITTHPLAAPARARSSFHPRSRHPFGDFRRLRFELKRPSRTTRCSSCGIPVTLPAGSADRHPHRRPVARESARRDQRTTMTSDAASGAVGTLRRFRNW